MCQRGHFWIIGEFIIGNLLHDDVILGKEFFSTTPNVRFWGRIFKEEDISGAHERLVHMLHILNHHHPF
jgi:hypothetical protein